MQPNDTIAAATTLAAARLARQAGISVVPVTTDGSKKPLGSWKAYQETPATNDEIDGWFESSNYGIGFIGGKVSGGLEFLDFDDLDYADFHTRAREVGLGPLVDKIADGYLVETPRGGRHLAYRCEVIAGSQKLASKPEVSDGKKRQRAGSRRNKGRRWIRCRATVERHGP